MKNFGTSTKIDIDTYECGQNCTSGFCTNFPILENKKLRNLKNPHLSRIPRCYQRTQNLRGKYPGHYVIHTNKMILLPKSLSPSLFGKQQVFVILAATLGLFTWYRFEKRSQKAPFSFFLALTKKPLWSRIKSAAGLFLSISNSFFPSSSANPNVFYRPESTDKTNRTVNLRLSFSSLTRDEKEYNKRT